ncbi:MAG TPA: flagellar protein FliS [Terracidiphilus sp.]|jgi:flagellar protein FliS|nr:flagellar protein FliS [Terracidiphilus sp.]
MSPIELTYRKTAASTGASGLGLLIGLYDTLAGSLRRAAQAERENAIEKRCREVNHALMVIGYLEDALSQGDGGELAQQLASIYASLRCKVIEAQAKRSAELLEQQMNFVLKIREQWQALEFRCESGGPEILKPIQTSAYPGMPATQMDEMQLSWSA